MDVFDISPVKYVDGELLLLDQTLLPNEEHYIEIKTKEDIWEAIRNLRVRGAPAIGVAAAYGLYISVRDIESENVDDFVDRFREVKEYLESARPTAVNLPWALARMERALLESCGKAIEEINGRLLAEAEKIRDEDENACLAMGEYGLSLLRPGMGILTHCNAGTIATAKYGTCLAPIYIGNQRGYGFKVFADETRPLLQGARITAFELSRAGVDVTLICDNMVSAVMQNGWVNACLVGCDRIAANGDTANKIGTSGVAILAKHYGIPFYVLGPSSSIDRACKSGEDIRIETRPPEEIRELFFRTPIAPQGVKCYNPAFDVTDHSLIHAIVTEKGICKPPFEAGVAALFGE